MQNLPGLYKRGRIYWFTQQVQGSRKFISLKTGDLSEAIRLVSELTTAPMDASGAAVSNLIEPYLAHKVEMRQYSPASVCSKRAVLNKFATFTQSAPAADIGRATMQAFYQAQRTAKLTDDTAAGYLAVVRAFFRWCVDVKRLRRDNPCQGLQLARVAAKARRDFCTPELVERLIAECPRDDLKFVLFCGFHCGLRKNEIIEARPFWFDVPNGQLHLRKHDGIQFKDQEERSLPLTFQFVDFLKKYGLRDPYMLHPEVTKGRSLYRYDFKRPFANYMVEQQCKWVTPHVMRHTYASLLASAGESIFNIAVWLGDDVRVVQKHYAKLLPVKRDVGLAFQSRRSVTS